MSFLLDTNSCIGFLNGRSARVRQRLEATPPGEVTLCSVVKAERAIRVSARYIDIVLCTLRGA